jgi:hypothetical protein
MSIFVERLLRDDMFALANEGFAVDREKIKGKRLGKIDNQHISSDRGRILPSNFLMARNDRKIGIFKGVTFRLGVAHSHDPDHLLHVLEDVPAKPSLELKKFRTSVRNFREKRKASRDR